MRIVYLGSGQFGIESLNALIGSKHRLEFVVTQPPRSAGRGRKERPTAAAEWARQQSIPFVETDDAASQQIIEKVASFKPELIVVIAFGQKICNELIGLPPKGIINVHGSLLPKYRGAAPINWAIVNGETETGITIATITEQWDAGKILAQAKTEIGNDETAGELHDRLAALAAPILVETIDEIEAGTAVYNEQDHSKATRAPKLKKSDGYIDFDEAAETVRNKIRGFWPWPGASAMYKSNRTGKQCRVIFALAHLVPGTDRSGLAPGTLDENLNVICGRDALKIIRIQPAGKGVMEFRDFVNGHRTERGDVFMKIAL